MVTKGRQRPLVFANEAGGALRPLLRLVWVIKTLRLF